MTQRRFANTWGELDYLCKKIHYWLYSRKQKTSARRYRNRLERVLQDLSENNSTILRQEGLALLHELKGEIGESIAHRKQEIELMERLHKESRSAKYADNTRAYLLRDRDVSDLKERRAILETLEKRNTRQKAVDIPNGAGPTSRQPNARHRAERP
jgi:hypothetical protein